MDEILSAEPSQLTRECNVGVNWEDWPEPPEKSTPCEIYMVPEVITIRSPIVEIVTQEGDDKEGWENPVTSLSGLVASTEELDHHATTVEEPENMETHEEADQVIQASIDQSHGLIKEPEQTVEWCQKQDEPEKKRKRDRESSLDLLQQSLITKETAEDDIGYSLAYKDKMSDAPGKTEPAVRSNAKEILRTGYMETHHDTSQMKHADESWHTTVSEHRVLRTEGDHLEPLPILPDPPDAEVSVMDKHLRYKPPTSKEVTTKPIRETVEERKEYPADPPDPQPPQKKQKRRQKKKEWVQKRPGIRSPKEKSGHWRHKPPTDPRDEFLSFIEEYIEDPFLDHLLEDMRSWDKPYTHRYLVT